MVEYYIISFFKKIVSLILLKGAHHLTNMIQVLLPHLGHWRIRIQLKAPAAEPVVLQSELQILREPTLAIFGQVLPETLFAQHRP